MENSTIAGGEAEKFVQELQEFISEQQQLRELVVNNFDNTNGNSRLLLQRLLLQSTQAQTLLGELSGDYSNDRDDIRKEQKTLCLDSPEYKENFDKILKRTLEAQWMVGQFRMEDKIPLAKRLWNKLDFYEIFAEDLEMLEFITLTVFEKLCRSFAKQKKGTKSRVQQLLLLLKLDLNFDSVRQWLINKQTNELEHEIKRLAEIIATTPDENDNDVDEHFIPNTDEIYQALEALRHLPLGHLRRPFKNYIFTLLLSLYSDLKFLKGDDKRENMFELILDFLHFGQNVQIFNYFNLETMLRILPVTTCWPFYEFIFVNLSRVESGNTGKFLLLKSLKEHLEKYQNEISTQLPKEYCRLLLLAIEKLDKIKGPTAKRFNSHLIDLLRIYSKYIQGYFKDVKPDSEKSTKVKKFVEKTLAGFAPYVKVVVLSQENCKKTTDAEKKVANGDEIIEKSVSSEKINKKKRKKEEQMKSKEIENENDDEKKREDSLTTSLIPLDDNFRKICKIYVGHSMNYKNPHAIRVLQLSLQHRQQLHLDQDEIEFVLNHYWQQLNEDLQTNIKPLVEETDSDTAATINDVVKLIIGNQTNEDLLLTLKNIENLIKDEKNFQSVVQLLTLIAKCPFSTVKGAIFNEQFKQITSLIAIRLPKDKQLQNVDYKLILSLLSCKEALVLNKKIPISTDTLDNILGFLSYINIKDYSITDTNINEFKNLHTAMESVCTALIKHRHILLMDRVPIFMHIFRDLLQSIILYKNERQKDNTLSLDELKELAELVIKLEALMHLIVSHAIDFKRVAPFVLTFIINLMVTSKRPTTLYPQIKTHVESICYDLIGICDHRVGRFILRASNEAARQVYEVLLKEYEKYHKFKGKV